MLRIGSSNIDKLDTGAHTSCIKRELMVIGEGGESGSRRSEFGHDNDDEHLPVLYF